MSDATEHGVHGHGLGGTWDDWLKVPALRVVLGVVAVIGLLTLVAIVALWPDGDGQQETIDQATRLGLVTDQFEATVTGVTEGPCSYSTPEDPQECRAFSFIIDEGPDAGVLIDLPEFNLTIGVPTPILAEGDTVFLGYEPTTDYYFYADRDRGSVLIWLTLVFVIVVVVLGRMRGLLALTAMAFTVAVLVGFVAPSVLDGNDPLLVAVTAASAIAFLSFYLTHGFTPSSTVALTGTLASLLLTLGIASLFFSLSNFSGLATEEGLTLPLLADINLSSLLLGGAMLGTLGALDDVTITQVATVAELKHRNNRLTMTQLLTSGIRVGREHIASVVNTLLLAYAGASMPLLLLFAASEQPLGTVANSELVAVEIVRTLTGSIGLVAAVPVTTFMAAVLLSGEGAAEAAGDHGHHEPSPDDDHGEVHNGNGHRHHNGEGHDDREVTGEDRPPFVGHHRPARVTHERSPVEARQKKRPATRADREPVTEPGPAPAWDDFAPNDVEF
ncbi:MAG: YibE/F family protein [Actinomycetota bacterium]